MTAVAAKNFIEPIGFVPDPIVVSMTDFNRMSEYSCSLPTGTTPGKYWKRDNHFGSRVALDKRSFDWTYCIYVDIPDLTRIGIRYQPLFVAEGVILEAILHALCVA